MSWKNRTPLTHTLKEYILKGLVGIIYHREGDTVLSENWNHMIILDDCRYDIFEKEFKRRNLPGELSHKMSLGSWTGEFLIKNFNQEYYDDIVYISANPFVDKFLKGKFYSLVSVWRTRWSEEYQTVLPRDVYNAAIKALEKYPHKRLIVHFLQPHHPYLSLDFKDKTMGIIRDSITNGRLQMDSVQDEPINKLYLSPIYALFDVHRLVEAYKENLRIVLPYVELLLHRFRGISVVTSDHGELFGERVVPFVPIEVYGHGIGRNNNLIKVPWWIITDEERGNLRPLKEIVKEITTIEKRFLLKRTEEKARLKRAISQLKLKGRI